MRTLLHYITYIMISAMDRKLTIVDNINSNFAFSFVSILLNLLTSPRKNTKSKLMAVEIDMVFTMLLKNCS